MTPWYKIPFIELAKIWADTLKPRGKYEMKRIAAFTAQWQAFIYLFFPVIIPGYQVDSVIFGLLIAGGAWSTEKLQQEKYKQQPPSGDNETIG